MASLSESLCRLTGICFLDFTALFQITFLHIDRLIIGHYNSYIVNDRITIDMAKRHKKKICA